MATPVSSDVLNQETDALFWAQTGYKPGLKLDPKIPTDKAMVPVWMDIFRKVQGKARTGSLVTTYDHPRVAQALSDAEVAGRAAAVHVAAAAETPDPAHAQDNIAAATTASQVSTQRAREAAAAQPPMVNPELVRKAGQEAAASPPPPQAPPAEQIAHAHARDHAHSHARGVHSQAREAREALYKETNARFWEQTHYKPGQNLDMTIEQDRKMAPVWMDIFHQVQREAKAGTSTTKSEPPAPAPSPPLAPPVVAPPRAPSPPLAPPVVAPPRTGPPVPGSPRSPMGPLMPPSSVPRPSMGPPRPMWPWTGPMWPWMGPSRGPQMPGHPPSGPQMGPQMPGRPPSGPAMGPQMPGHPPSGPAMGPSMDPSMDPSMGPHESTPPETSMPPGGGSSTFPSGPSGEALPGAPGEGPTPPAEESSGVGKYIAIGLAVIAGGGLLYYATTRSPARKPPSRQRARKTFVIPRPPRAASAAMARSMPAQGGPELELEE
jgi:hypothetical protein